MWELIGCLFWIAVGVAYAVGWLVVKLFDELLIPYWRWQWAEGERCWERLAVWHHRVTWRRRMLRAHNETIARLDAIRREHVAMAREELRVIDRQQQLLEALTADRTAAVPGAVRGDEKTE